jgi:hypothetical protein
MQEFHKGALVEWIDDHWTAVLFRLTLAAFAAPFIVTDGFEHVCLVVPFAFALVILPGLIANHPCERSVAHAHGQAQTASGSEGDGRALRATWSAYVNRRPWTPIHSERKRTAAEVSKAD